MFNKELRKKIGTRIKTRRKELGLTLQYVAERMDVSASTIQRYEQGSIDNTKKLIVEGLADVLRVSPEWIVGKTDEIEDTHSAACLMNGLNRNSKPDHSVMAL